LQCNFRKYCRHSTHAQQHLSAFPSVVMMRGEDHTRW